MKRKINKKILVLAAAALCVAAVSLAAYVLMSRNADEKEEVSVGDNQRMVYGYLTSVLGNEISYTEVEASVAEAMIERQENAADAEKTDGENNSKTGQENAADDNGEQNSRGRFQDNAGGTPPDMSARQGENPPDMENSQTEGRKQNAQNSSGMGGGESITTLIPVGTVVHTTTDTETTFSRLAAGDLVKLLLETTEEGEETIVEIWMVQ